MPHSVSPLPSDFSWLRPADRPSAREVETYTHIIAHAEGYPPAVAEERLRKEAELQLWIWHAENPRATTKRRNPAAAPVERAHQV